MAAVDGSCTAGFFCSKNSVTASPAVSYSVKSSEVWNTNTLTTEAKTGNDYGLCKLGFYCEEGVTTMTQCPIGTYLKSEGATSSSDCQTCSPGHYCSEAGLIQSTQCPAGYFCGGGSSTSTSNPCDAGSKCPIGSPAKTLCPAGSFQS